MWVESEQEDKPLANRARRAQYTCNCISLQGCYSLEVALTALLLGELPLWRSKMLCVHDCDFAFEFLSQLSVLGTNDAGVGWKKRHRSRRSAPLLVNLTYHLHHNMHQTTSKMLELMACNYLNGLFRCK